MGVALHNARLFNETQEALARQTATSDVLQVISESPTDVQPVFDIIAERAAALTNARYCLVTRFDGEWLHLASLHGVNAEGTAALRDAWPQRLEGSTSIAARAIRQRGVINVADLMAESDADYSPSMKRVVERAGFRSGLSVPMLHGEQIVGAITVNRAETGLYADKEVALLQTFARQAVVAIENVRLFNETREALHEVEERTTELTESLEYQTAISEVLRVISESPTDVAPVFEVIMDCGMRLFQPRNMAIMRTDGRLIHVAATRNWSAQAIAQAAGVYPLPVDEHSLAGRVILARQTIAVEDTQDERAYALAPLARTGGWRRMVAAPMLRDGLPVGTIHVAWPDAGQTPQRQIDLLQTFADQAVIAIENVRLLNETKEALEQQKASAEVLSVISNSVSDSAPVFEAIVQSCQRLFGSASAIISLVGEDGMVRHEAIAVTPRQQDMTAEDARRFLDRGYPRPLAQGYQSYPIRKRRVVHYPDMINGPGVPEAMRQMGRDVGNFSMLIAPMLWQGEGIGTIHVTRFPPQPFSDKEIALLKTFADQAVIAIQNARMFKDTHEALERQTATAEILRVISESPTDVQPVFEAIVQSGVRLFAGAAVAISRPEDGEVRSVAIAEGDPERAARWRNVFPFPLSREFVHGAAILDCQTIDIPDVLETGGQFAAGKKNLSPAGYRAMTVVPMVREGTAIGAIAVVRLTPGSLSAKQMALLQTFASQAVIAIENVRLFNETKEALEQQTATADVLQVIGASVADTQPVFDKIVDSCRRLFATTETDIFIVDDSAQLHLAAAHGPAREALRRSFPRPLAGGGIELAIQQRRVLHYRDVLADADVPAGAAHRGRAGRHRHLFAGGGADDVGGPRHRRDHRRAPARHRLFRQGARPAQDLRRPGRDRDPERAPVQADAGSASRGRSRERGQERLPGDDEPRDPHADERGDRHERAAARHAAHRRAARLRHARSATRATRC